MCGLCYPCFMREDGVIRSPDTLRNDRVPPGQTLRKDWPVLHYGPVQRLEVSSWTLTLFGLIDRARKLTFSEFASLPHIRVLSDIHCVTTWSRLDNLWEGISTSALRDLTGILPEARFVIVHGAGGFTTNLSLDDFFQPDVLFALSHDARTLSPEHGYPVRLVVPRLYLWKSAKWVTAVEFVREDRPGFWESHGYHMRGDPWNEERYGI